MKMTHPRLPRLKAILFQTLLALSLVSAGSAANAMEMQSIDSGEVLNLEEFTGKGKWTLVMFWATNCHICVLQKPEISAFHDNHKDSDAEVIGIALDGVEELDAIQSYIDTHKPSFPNYVGNMAIVASYYFGMTEDNFRGTPTYLLFNPEGELLGNNPGRLSVEAIESFMQRKTLAAAG